MNPSDIVHFITTHFEGVVPKQSWGETSMFYNPGKRLPNGVYFCTVKEKDGDNDKASNLGRDQVFRLSIGITKSTFESQFGSKPKRPSKGGIIDGDYDFTETNVLMPHPIYGWMSWVQILNPDRDKFEAIIPLIRESHANAVAKFRKKVL